MSFPDSQRTPNKDCDSKNLYNCDSNSDQMGSGTSKDAQAQCSLTTEWMTTDEAAKFLKVSVQALRNMTSNGKVPYYKFARRNRYRLEDLQKLLLKNPRGGFYGN